MGEYERGRFHIPQHDIFSCLVAQIEVQLKCARPTSIEKPADRVDRHILTSRCRSYIRINRRSDEDVRTLSQCFFRLLEPSKQSSTRVITFIGLESFLEIVSRRSYSF